jgi:hypothetical protein
MARFLDGLFSLAGNVAVVTGATVVFGGADGAGYVGPERTRTCSVT